MRRTVKTVIIFIVVIAKKINALYLYSVVIGVNYTTKRLQHEKCMDNYIVNYNVKPNFWADAFFKI